MTNSKSNMIKFFCPNQSFNKSTQPQFRSHPNAKRAPFFLLVFAELIHTAYGDETH